MRNGNKLFHHGIKGQKWGVRRYQNEDGTLTQAGKDRYRARYRIFQNRHTNEDVERIYRALTDSGKRYIQGLSESDALSEVSKWLENDESTATIAKRFVQYYKDIPVSFLEVYDNGKGVGEIAIATDPRYEGKGYAQKNIESAVKWLDSRKNTTVNELRWNALKGNDQSYRKAVQNGFKLEWADARWNSLSRYKKN